MADRGEWQALFSDTKCGGFGDAKKCEEDYVCKNVKAYCEAAGIEEGQVVKGRSSLLPLHLNANRVKCENSYSWYQSCCKSRGDYIECAVCVLRVLSIPGPDEG